MGPPVLNRYKTFPEFASSTRKSPFSSPVRTRFPDVVVTAATTGFSDRYFHFTAPDVASTAVIQPCQGLSDVTVPPMNIFPATRRDSSEAVNVAHQSTAPT